MTSKHSSSFFDWLRQPNSLLALAATIISASTFFLVYVREGELAIDLPDRIGIAVNDTDLELVIPIAVTNTGAPIAVKRVRRATAIATVKEDRAKDQPIELAWLFEKSYMGRRQYFQKYPEKMEEVIKCQREAEQKCIALMASSNKSGYEKTCQSKAEGECITDDYLDYVGRPVPFVLKGGESVHKVFEFIQPPNLGKRWGQVRGFDLTVTLHTETKTFSSKTFSFDCGNIELFDRVASYCREVGVKPDT
jgi:hypothetical protein